MRYRFASRKTVSRSYVVDLQHRVKALENELAIVKTDELEDPEVIMRSAAAVRMQESEDAKFLGPSSGICMTRLVIQLAKECTGSDSIKDVITDAQAKDIKDRFVEEDGKPFSKVYPLTSNIAAEGLPSDRGLVDRLVHLFNLKVQPWYPMLHEPTFKKDLEAVYAGSDDPYQQFVVRMVIAISLQKVDSQYAGLADSYYLAALQSLQPIIEKMDLKTLQCCCLIGEYSLLTSTRTAVYYIIGLAMRLLQSLGLNEERTLTRTRGGGTADFLEIDMKRRLFWCTWVMDLGLAHSLGRPSALATSQDHIDVKWFSTVDDAFITPEGIVPGGGTPSLRKWVAIHFTKMRLLQLEIRRKLYLKKRDEPKDDRHPWFQHMEKKMKKWRDISPEDDVGMGLDKFWFIGRYHTMVVLLYRPCPQIPRPSVDAARKCFEACEFNIYSQRKQAETRSIELTWIFSQSLFMAVNTLLWCLSYAEIRRTNSKEKVSELFNISLDAILLASERWPGVASAHELYRNLIGSCLRIYDMNGDLPVAAPSPDDSTSPESVQSHYRSRTESPATLPTPSIATTPESTDTVQQAYTRQSNVGLEAAGLYDFVVPLHGLPSPSTFDFSQPPTLAPLRTDTPPANLQRLPSTIPVPDLVSGIDTSQPYEARTPRASIPLSPTTVPNLQPFRSVLEPDPESSLLVPPNFSNLPWDKSLKNQFDSSNGGPKYSRHGSPLQSPRHYGVKDESFSDYQLYPDPQHAFYLDPDLFGMDQGQQTEILHTLETTGRGDLDKQIREGRAMYYPSQPTQQV
ncbi:MAG: hypothetical protein Q9157_007537 [Trypethelium eluteriae]